MAYEAFIADTSNTILEDISAFAADLVVGPRKNRPTISGFRVPTHKLTSANPLQTGTRRLIVKRNGAVVANDILWVKDAQGDPDTGYADIVAMGPMIRWQKRWVQDANGQIFDGVSSDGTDRGLDLPAGGLADPDLTVSGGSLLKQIIENTIANDGPVGVTTSGGTFDISVPPALNVRFALRNITPISVGDMATLLFDSGAVDAVIQPIATAGEAQGILSATNAAGTDRPSIHFQYNTGDRNCSHAQITESMDEFANKVWYELGTREGSHFRNNVTRDAPGVTVDDSDSRDEYGVYHDIVIHDEFSGKIPTSSAMFEAYVRLYNAELSYRIKPRKVLKITPQAGMGIAPWDDFSLGDTVRASVVGLGDDFYNATLRIHGWNARPDNDSSAERVELLLVSDDE